jgi:hypothetical protein
MVNDWLKEVIKLYEELPENEMYPPSTSEYAKPETCPAWPQKHDRNFVLEMIDPYMINEIYLHICIARSEVKHISTPQDGMLVEGYQQIDP